MTDKEKLILALQQVENISEIVRGNIYEGFFSSHLLPTKYEIIRQLSFMQENKEKL